MDNTNTSVKALQQFLRQRGVVATGLRKQNLLELCKFAQECGLDPYPDKLIEDRDEVVRGKQIDGIWHTGIVVYGKEFFFGGGSIASCPPGGTIMGQPQQVEELGTTEIPEEVFMDHLHELAVTSYRADQYHLLHHNCNTFSDEVARFLTGKGIPAHITSLPQEFLNTPFGRMVQPFIDSMSVTPGGQSHPVFTDRQLQGSATSSTPASSAPAASSKPPAGATAAPSTPASAPPPPAHTYDLEPASYTADISTFIMNKNKLESVLSEQDFALLEEVQEYLTKSDCSWAPARPHALVIDKLLRDSSLGLDEVVRVAVGSLLQNLLLKDDIVIQFTRDPQSKKVLNKLVMATKFHTLAVQEVAIKSMCNISKSASFRDTLHQHVNEDSVSVQSLCDVCIACVLSEPSSNVNNYATALVYNVTLCKITEEQAVSLGSALVQHLTTSENAEFAKYSLHALLNCMKKNAEVVSFAAVMGLDAEDISPADSSLQAVKREITERLESVQ